MGKLLSIQCWPIELYLGPLKNANKFNTFISSGLRVFMHDGSFLAPSAREILIEMGKQTNIEIRKTLTTKGPLPHSQCQDLNGFESNSFNYVKHLNPTYRQRDWIQKCDCFYTLLPVLLIDTNNKARLPCLIKTQFNFSVVEFFELFFNVSNLVFRFFAERTRKNWHVLIKK